MNALPPTKIKSEWEILIHHFMRLCTTKALDLCSIFKFAQPEINCKEPISAPCSRNESVWQQQNKTEQHRRRCLRGKMSEGLTDSVRAYLQTLRASPCRSYLPPRLSSKGGCGWSGSLTRWCSSVLAPAGCSLVCEGLFVVSRAGSRK